jgi:hypothetical protein
LNHPAHATLIRMCNINKISLFLINFELVPFGFGAAEIPSKHTEACFVPLRYKRAIIY